MAATDASLISKVAPQKGMVSGNLGSQEAFAQTAKVVSQCLCCGRLSLQLETPKPQAC